MNISRTFPGSNFILRYILMSNKQRSQRIKTIPLSSDIRKQLIRSGIFAGLGFTWATKNDTQTQNVTKVQTLLSVLESADSLFENGHFDECYKLLTDFHDQGDVEIQWRICRVLYNMSNETKCEENCKKEFILRAYEIISQLLQNHSDHFAVQKWYALLLDTKSSYDGIKERIKQLENVKKHMDLAVMLNPNDATVLHMLGEWCYQVAELPWHQRKIAEVLFATPPCSTYEEALEYYLRAESIQPRFYSLNLLRLGHCYLKLKKEDQAKYYLKLAASYPAKSNDDHRANKEAAELLKKIKF